MSAPAQDHYIEREQTWVKHAILRQYLLRFALIVGNWRDTITYVDCFSGPWQNKAADYSDTSFAIAIGELKKAKQRHPRLKIRCLFIEKNPKAFAELKKFSESVADVEVLVLQGELEEHIDRIIEFNRNGGVSNFPFIFIDPTGWTGFAMDKIAPLLRLNPGEVLINFMTKDIRRFVDEEEQNYSGGFGLLYGDESFRDELRKTSAADREDRLVSLYGEAVKRKGNYEHVVYTPVFQPTRNAIHFHLVYASRNLKGLSVFKEEEKKAVVEMEKKRAEAQKRKREQGGELDLLACEDLHDKTYYSELRTRYLERLTAKVAGMVAQQKRIPFDLLYEEALTIPLVWKSDLDELLTELKTRGEIVFEEVMPTKRVLDPNSGHIVARVVS